MGLVDYSDSESDSEVPGTKAPPRVAAAGQAPVLKKTVPKLLNRSATGKILVNLPTGSAANSDDGPPAKRARTEQGSNASSRFSGFSSFLPPPKNPNALKRSAANSESSGAGSDAGGNRKGGAAPRIGLHLRTSAEAAFSRSVDYEGLPNGDENIETGGLKLPPPKTAAKGPTIPEGQKPEEEVKLVGKPLMFKPLSVARKPAKKKDKSGTVPPRPTAKHQALTSRERVDPPMLEDEGPKKRKISLFSTEENEEAPPTHTAEASGALGAYEPMFEGATTADDGLTEDHETVAQNAHIQHATFSPAQGARAAGQQQSLSAIADELNLSAKERRELFGRNGGGGGNIIGDGANAKVVSFNMEREYAANEALRASGEQVMHNPVRSIAPGKHSLRQVVNMAQTNSSALEESFARQRTNRNEAAGRYGWK